MKNYIAIASRSRFVDAAMDCTRTAMQSLFHRGGTVSPWGVYVDKYNAPFISNI